MNVVEREYRATFLLILSLAIAVGVATSIGIIFDNHYLVVLALPMMVPILLGLHRLANYIQSRND